MQAAFAMMGAGAVVLAAAAHVADRRRLGRRDLYSVGFMPWPAIAMAGTVGAILLFALALKSG